jgi:uncharacterized protein (TIGR00290 family)
MSQKVIFSWSGGKDSAIALYELQKKGEYDLLALITTVTVDYGRVSMHGLRTELLHSQAASLNIPLEEILISKDASNEEYESSLNKVLLKYKETGIRDVVFGDIFLEDIKEYREALMSGIGMECVFPIWKMDSSFLAGSFINSGFRAVVVCVDTEQLDAQFAGREFDERFLRDLPDGVDPCGENGEFHTFVYDGPIYSNAIAHSLGEIVIRDGRFCYCDILPS